MSLTLGDNFSYGGSKPLDARLSFATLADMKAVVDATMYNGCIAYCVATDKTYQWKSTNTVDADTGRWREFSSGGSSEDPNAYHTGDTAFTDIADGDFIPVYDTSDTAKKKTLWSNIKSLLKTYFDTLYNMYILPTASANTLGGVKIGQNLEIDDGVLNGVIPVMGTFSREGMFSETEKVVGCWIDGRPLYKKTIQCTMPQATTDGTEVVGSTATGISINECVKYDTYLKSSNFRDGNYVFGDSATKRLRTEIKASNGAWYIEFRNAYVSANAWVPYVTLYYTKTTDAANSFKLADENDYSTEEHVVGTWIDGKPVYQKVVYIGAGPNNTTKNVAHGISNLNHIVKLRCIGYITSNPREGWELSWNDNTTAINVDIDATNVRIKSNGDSSGESYYAVIQYTKTTD